MLWRKSPSLTEDAHAYLAAHVPEVRTRDCWRSYVNVPQQVDSRKLCWLLHFLEVQDSQPPLSSECHPGELISLPASFVTEPGLSHNRVLGYSMERLKPPSLTSTLCAPRRRAYWVFLHSPSCPLAPLTHLRWTGSRGIPAQTGAHRSLSPLLVNPETHRS